MAEFVCDRCGKCCSSLGPHIRIERQLNERDYYCRSAVDNIVFEAHVDPEYREEIADEFDQADPGPGIPQKKPCVFLRKPSDREGTVCAIYNKRPPVCRNFRCYRALIRNRDGAVCGRIIGKSTLRTDDAILLDLWNSRVAAVFPGDQSPAKAMEKILAEHGYTAFPVE